MPSISGRTIVLEVTAAILLVGGAVALATSGNVVLTDADVHPLWIPVLVFAARYAVRGMFIALLMATAALAAASLAEYGTLAALSLRASNPHDMVALLSATLVAWTAMTRDGRLAQVVRARDDMQRRVRDSEETVNALGEVVGVLRCRLDRIDLSIHMWREIARRLDHGPLPSAATAALELASLRTGAAAGQVQRCGNGSRLQTIATFGPMGTPTSDISRDRTVLNAMAFRRAALRSDLPDALPEDSDVAVPIMNADGAVLGVLAMRETPPTRLHAAEVRDLEVVASWLADSFASPQLQVGGGAAC